MQYLSFHGCERKYPHVMAFLEAELPHLGKPWHGIALDLSQARLSGQMELVMQKLLGSQVRALDLSLNNLDDQDARIVAEAAKINRQLKRVVLCGNQIGDMGAGTVASAMKINTGLRVDLQNNRVGPNGAQQFVAACVDTRQETIDLSHNQLGDQGAMNVAIQLNRSAGNVKSLDLTYNNIGEKGDQALASLPRRIKIFHRLEKVSLVEKYPGRVALCVLGTCGVALIVLKILDCLGFKVERPAEGCRYHKIMDEEKRK